jgi:predicted DNA-binding transcriptional regulator AlpA
LAGVEITEDGVRLIKNPPRAFRADCAAAYLAIGKTKFLELVDEGRLPQPVRIDGVTTWDRLELDAAYERMKQEEGEIRRNPIEEHYGIGTEQ